MTPDEFGILEDRVAALEWDLKWHRRTFWAFAVSYLVCGIVAVVL